MVDIGIGCGMALGGEEGGNWKKWDCGDIDSHPGLGTELTWPAVDPSMHDISQRSLTSKFLAPSIVNHETNALLMLTCFSFVI